MHETPSQDRRIEVANDTDATCIWFHRGRTTYTHHNDVANAESLRQARIAHLEKGGYEALDSELHIDPAADPKVWCWILFIR